MRLRITVDNLSHDIDSTDPELLGKWVVEIFARTGPFTPATYVQIQATPSWLPSEAGRGRSDWIADSRIIGGVFQALTPQGLVDGLQKQLNEALNV